MREPAFRVATCTAIALLSVFLTDITGLHAQPKPSFTAGYEYFPFSNLKDPDLNTFERDLEVRVSTFYGEFSLAPIIRSQGRTVIVNTLSYHRFDLDYRNWDNQQGGNRIENTQGIEYTFVLVRQLSEKWNMTVVATPGVHSDLVEKLSMDDFNVQGAVIFGRLHSGTLTYGFGAAYTLKYGEPFPLPFVTLQWNKAPNWRADLLLPVHAELWYLPSQRVELGLTARVKGSDYHGSPKRYLVGNPRMRYSVVTAGPSIKLHFSNAARLLIDGGVTMLRRFEFFDGSRELRSLDLKSSPFVRAGLQFGG